MINNDNININFFKRDQTNNSFFIILFSINLFYF